ncbi:hypothetical protein ACH5RR_012034 [Cinchona calisaya]|uniref:Oxidative stress 3 n=1 Tax=Cinchona calisaya TaxID=153742 RepID=A0ABD3A867_9GENT
MMTKLMKMDSFVFNQQNNHGITDDDQKNKVVVCDGDVEDADSFSSDVSSVVSSDNESDDLFDQEGNSCASSSTTTPTSPTSGSNSSSDQIASGDSGPLQDLSCLLQELPFKRGLSKHYNGKSQSFTSLANVRCLEDLAKPENPYNKKLKSCKSYGGLFHESHGASSSNQFGGGRRLMSKKTSRGSCSSLCVKRNSSFIGNRPPIPPPPHRSTSTSNFAPQTPLFTFGV